MRCVRLLVMVLAAASACPADEHGSDWLDLLARVNEQMRDGMKRMPNFTCTEKIERRIYSVGNSSRCEYMDRVRLAVAVIGGREAFAWPENSSFDRVNPVEIIGEGPIGTGDFFGFARTVFISDAPTYTYRGFEIQEGQALVRFDYRVPKEKSRYLIRAGLEATVGFHGSFWVNPTTAHVAALEVNAEDIPEAFGVAEVRTLITYAQKELEGELHSFPESSELFSKERDNGRELRNRIEFSDCRRYTGESTLIFGDTAPGAHEATRETRNEVVPPGLKIDVTLDTPIDIGKSGAGDRITATVQRPVKGQGFDIPAGAKLIGRILRFSVDIQALRTLVAFEFNGLRVDDREIEFIGRLRSRGSMRGLTDLSSSKTLTASDLAAITPEWRNAARWRLSHPLTRIKPGFKMTWETTAQPHVHNR